MMDTREIFTRLMKLRNRIEADLESQMESSDNALLYDVAKTLGLSSEQAAELAGDSDPITSAHAPEQKAVYDFDGGFGIGGLAHHQEKPIIPTIEQIERLKRMEASAMVCRKCKQSDVFDGAMFTTVGGNICDDCCG
jgi:hypothetical protein